MVWVEMLEAVGEEYWLTFFANLRQRLTPQGIAVLQVITIDQSRFRALSQATRVHSAICFSGGSVADK